MEIISQSKSHNGTQFVYRHDADTLRCSMNFGIYLPDNISAPAPALFWLSGLTCTENNFITKAGAQRVASELGMILVAPDTSPRGEGVPDDPDGAYDFGLGAGFYVNAIQPLWQQHYQMRDYVEQELHQLVMESFPVDHKRLGIFGHSMGGHGALTMALRSPDKFRSVSAFSPICSPINSPWGEKALKGYLGDDPSIWREYDACSLINDGAHLSSIFVDQGTDDSFLNEQLKPDLLDLACSTAGIDLTLRMQPGFDHSYYFIASFMEDHLRWHSDRLR